MMTSPAKPSFLRLFVGGFAIGTAAMVSIHLVQPGDIAMVPPAQAQTQAHIQTQPHIQTGNR